MEIRLSEIVVGVYQEHFINDNYTEECYTTGRAGGKSTNMLGNKAIFEAISNPSAQIIMRKRHNKLRKTVYQECIRAIHRFGLNPNKDFKCTVSPMQITYLENGSTIYFSGNDNIDDTKGLIDPIYPIRNVYIDEVNEFFEYGDGEDEIENIKATFIRGNNESFKTIYLFNPPKNPKAKVMEWLNKVKQKPSFKHVHTDYRNLPVELVGGLLVEEAELTRQLDEKLYRWLWLGETIGLDDVIYHMFKEERHVKKFQRDALGHLGIGVDYGQMNATTFEAFGLSVREKKVKGIAEYYHSGRESGKQKSPSEYALDFQAFVKDVEKKTNQRVQFCVIDPSAAGLAEEIARVMGRGFKIIKANNAVSLGITRVQKLLSFNVIEYNPSQENLIEEKSLYMWDEKSVARGEEKPLKENDHCMDAERYYIMAIWQYIVRLLPILKEREH